MRERPILFSGPMVRALLAGTKTQTRRAFSPRMEKLMRAAAAMGEVSHFLDEGSMQPNDLDYVRSFCPYGQPGDRLWVRETFGHFERNENFKPGCEVFYRADGNCLELEPWRPSIHMPRWASRILLEITAVRVERLQDISEADADAEGCERLDTERYERDWKLCPKCGGTRLHNALGGNGGVILDVDCWECDTYAKRYRHLWTAINGPGSWAQNPWVWVVEFERAQAQQKGPQQ